MSKHPSGLFKFEFDPSSDLRRVCVSACLWAEDECAKATRIDLTTLTRKLHGQTKVSLTWSEALMLRDCLKLHREERMAPKSPLTNDILLLEGAISDRDETVIRDMKCMMETMHRPSVVSETSAEREERVYREKRDAIFREMVGNPAKLNIWGFEEKEEALPEETPKYDLTSLNTTTRSGTAAPTGASIYMTPGTTDPSISIRLNSGAYTRPSTSVHLNSGAYTRPSTSVHLNPGIYQDPRINLYVTDSHPENNPYNTTVENSDSPGFTLLRHQAKPVTFPMQPEFSTPAVGKRFVVSYEDGEPLSDEETVKFLASPVVQYLLKDAGVDKG